MRLILSMLMVIGLAMPAAAEGRWLSIAVGQWEDETSANVRDVVRGYFPTEEEAAQAALDKCHEKGYNCQTYFSWEDGCAFATSAYLPDEYKATTYSATSRGEAYAACVEGGAEGCEFEDVVGGCAPGDGPRDEQFE